jgi:hypothetical protein
MAKREQPRWTTKADALVDSEVEEYASHLRRIAVRLARYEGAAYINPKLVLDAKDCLSRSGLNRRTFYLRPEIEFGAGTGLLALCPSVPDIVGIATWISEPHRPTFSWAAILAMAVVGIFLVLHGWFRGSS